MTTETTKIASSGGVRLERKALVDGQGREVHVTFVLYGPGPQERTFSSEAEAMAAFKKATQPPEPTPPRGRGRER